MGCLLRAFDNPQIAIGAFSEHLESRRRLTPRTTLRQHADKGRKGDAAAPAAVENPRQRRSRGARRCLADAIKMALNPGGRQHATHKSDEQSMTPGAGAAGERFDVAYLVLSGTTTAARCPELLRGLVGLGFATVIALPTPNASRVIAARELADVERVRLVQSYFDAAIRPRPPRGVVLFAPCSFNSLNKLAHGIADNLALSVVAEAIGRNTPVIVGPSLNAPLLNHPEARASLARLPGWGVTIVPPVDNGEGPRLAPTAALLDAVRPHLRCA
jgi:3-polyprenyl-4-hydroxybenzoate decarboxylase